MSDTVLNKGQYLHCSKISNLKLAVILQGLTYDYFMLTYAILLKYTRASF